MPSTSELGKLWQLQQLDVELKKLRSLLEKPKHQAEHDQAIAPARTALRQLKQSEETLETLAKQIRKGELELASIEAQIKEAESKLYGGTVTNARELAGIEQKLKLAREQREQQEESLLNTMQSSEKLQAEATQQKRNARKLTNEYKAIKTELDEEVAGLQQEIQRLSQERQAAVAIITAEWLNKYEKMNQHRTDPIAIVEGNECGACHVQIPNGILSQAKASEKPTFCECCRRLLYVID